MTVAIGSDHAGFPLKARVVEEVRACSQYPLDVGTYSPDPVDYPDYARAVALVLRDNPTRRGILICGTGVGACIAANRFPGIYAAVCHDTFSARDGVEAHGLNVLCLGARVIGQELAAEIVRAYLKAEFSGLDRHVRRLAKIEQLEKDFAA
jgi:ribose 5-phosphate isomerase B